MDANELPLVGRDSVVEDLRGALVTTAAGSGGCMVITGSAGIGKSRVLEVARAEAVERGMAVASGRANELDRAVPLTTLMTALRRAQPGDLDVSRISEGEVQYQEIDKLGEAIERYAADRALLIVLDDVHWMDEMSALALRVLVPVLSSSPVLWLLARRAMPSRSPARDTVDWLLEDGATELSLGPLPEDAVAQLCANVLCAPPDATVLSLTARTGGNPFLIEQLIISLRDSGQIRTGDDGATVIGEDLPSSFLTAVNRRLRGLSPLARRLVEVGSVFGGPFTLHAAATVTAVQPAELVAAAEEAMQAGVLVDEPPRLSFRHDLLAEAVYNNLAGPTRTVLHQEVAAVLQAEGHSAVKVAEHLVRGGQHNDRAVAVLRDAASQAAANAPGTAADLIIRALQVLGENHAARPELVGDAVRLLASAGRLEEAQELGEAALHSGLEPTTEALLLLGLSEALKHSGRNQMVVELTTRGLARPELPEAVAAQLLAIQAHALLQVDEFDAADRAGEEAVTRGTTAGEVDATVFGGVARSVVARSRGQLDRAAKYAEEAVRVTDRSGGAARQRHPRLWLGWALASLDRFDEAERAYATGQQEADRMETRWSQPLWHYYRASLLAARGQLADAQAWAEAGVRVAGQLAALQMTVPLHALMIQIAVRRGALADAGDHLARAEGLVTRGITAAFEDLQLARAVLQEASYGPAAAFRTLTELYDRLPERMLVLTNDPGRAGFLIRVAQQAGAADAARVVAASVRQLVDTNPTVPTIAGAAFHATGLVEGDREALLAAVAQLRSSPRRLVLASALEDAAAAEHAAGDYRSAGALLGDALRLYRDSDADRDADRVRRLLTACHDRSAAPGPEVSAPSVVSNGWQEQLTESELRVVRLVADGLTNREVAKRLYLSPHTVDSHLRHVFTKLGINSRVKLTRHFLDREEWSRAG